jgi:transcriptional regulator with XRE-family HTH domain
MNQKKAKLRAAFAARLRKLRGEASQTEFGKRIGATQGQVSQWEAGRGLPGIEAMARIARAVGVSLDDLTGAGK